MYKLGHLKGDRWAEHSHAAEFQLPTSEKNSALLIGVPGGDPAVFRSLTLCLEPPYHLLYVLHTPRGEGDAGRYQSPLLNTADFENFISEFGDYLSSDARFDIWAHSPEEKGTVVWDRHNQIFAYGPIEKFVSELRALGFHAGCPEIPSSHEHHYRSEYDALAQAVLKRFTWTYSPLRKEDEQ